MASIDEVFDRLGQIMERLRLLEERVVSADQVDIKEGLSDVSHNLGLQKSGEIRFGSGEPGKGDGFTGLRMASDGMSFGDTDYLMAGVDADTMQWGIRTSDGSLDSTASGWQLVDSTIIGPGNTDSTSVSFTIPGGTYKILNLQASGRIGVGDTAAGGSQLLCILNSDAGANYNSRLT